MAKNITLKRNGEIVYPQTLAENIFLTNGDAQSQTRENNLQNILTGLRADVDKVAKSEHFRGVFDSISSLNNDYTNNNKTKEVGDYAIIKTSTGADYFAIWDENAFLQIQTEVGSGNTKYVFTDINVDKTYTINWTTKKANDGTNNFNISSNKFTDSITNKEYTINWSDKKVGIGAGWIAFKAIEGLVKSVNGQIGDVDINEDNLTTIEYGNNGNPVSIHNALHTIHSDISTLQADKRITLITDENIVLGDLQTGIYYVEGRTNSQFYKTNSNSETALLTFSGCAFILKEGTGYQITLSNGSIYTGNTSLSDESNPSGMYKIATESYVGINGGKIDKIQKNGSDLAINNKTVNITVPTNNNELTNGAGYQTATDVSTAISTNNTNVVTPIDTRVTAIEGKIQSDASSSNKLTTESYVAANGGKIDTLSHKDTLLTIIPHKFVDTTFTPSKIYTLAYSNGNLATANDGINTYTITSNQFTANSKTYTLVYLNDVLSTVNDGTNSFTIINKNVDLSQKYYSKVEIDAMIAELWNAIPTVDDATTIPEE